jgi:hypothetical protein
MAKTTYQSNPKVRQIFNDLELYREFCADYGYKFDEATLGDMRSYAYQQFSKYSAGKNFKDQWADDARKLGLLI